MNDKKTALFLLLLLSELVHFWAASRDLYLMPRDFISLTTDGGRRPETEIAYIPLTQLSAKRRKGGRS